MSNPVRYVWTAVDNGEIVGLVLYAPPPPRDGNHHGSASPWLSDLYGTLVLTESNDRSRL